MFDTRKTGAKIMQLRKEKDMTQMELADLMQVSYQAVSNWERGNSMPDISKLADLARCLGVSIDELLDSSETAQTVRKALNEEQPLSMQEIASVAPILKPSRLSKDVEKAGLEKLDIKSLIEIAPYLSEEKVMQLIQAAQITRLEDLLPFAPFLDSKQVLEIVTKQEDLHHDLAALSAWAPFLDEDDLGEIATKVIEDDDDCRLILPLAPFLTSEKLVKLIALAEPDRLDEVVPLAPFMDSDDLMRLINDHEGSFGSSKGLVGLAPFLDGDDLSRIAQKFWDEEGIDGTFKELMPFLNEEFLTHYAKRCLAKGDIKTLKEILPFIDADELD